MNSSPSLELGFFCFDSQHFVRVMPICILGVFLSYETTCHELTSYIKLGLL